ncbi:hypothetical protein ACFLUF_00960 [Chloroflexota bacterium]
MGILIGEPVGSRDTPDQQVLERCKALDKELADIETVKGCVEELRNLLESTLITERKSFIRSIVKEVSVTSSEVSLDYTPQLLEGNDVKGDFPSFPYWSRWWAILDLNQ